MSEIRIKKHQKGIQRQKFSPRTPLSKSHISGKAILSDLGVFVPFLI